MDNKKLIVGHIKDVNNNMVFSNHTLCAQFLRDYTDIALLKDVKPEDITDDTKKYHAYLGIDFEGDTVKRIRIKGQDFPVFVISLIEHKSDVDYNVSMQLLKYMVHIWDSYAKEQKNNKTGDSRNKSFKYPPIIPIVYYEGAKNWTADLNLLDRIYMSEIFKDYLPAFNYKVVETHSYTNDELIAHNDEMSVFMLLNKIQTPADFSEFTRVNEEKISKLVKNANEEIMQIFLDVVWNLCMKLNVPPEEAEKCLENVRDGEMGKWFENMEKMDIQAERRNTEEARKALLEKEKELESKDKELESKDKELDKNRQEIESLKQELIQAQKEIAHLKESPKNN